MKNKIIKKAIVFILTFLLVFFCFPTTVYASGDVQESGTEETGGETGGDFSIIDKFLEGASNADVSDADAQRFNDEFLGGQSNLDIAKRSISKFLRSFSNKGYDKNDFNGKADEVYSGFTGFLEKVLNEGIIDNVYHFGESTVKLILKIFSSAADAAR